MSASSALGEILPRVLVPIAVIAFFSLARTYFIPKQADVACAANADTSVPSTIAVNLCMVVVAMILALSAHSLLVTTNRAIAGRDDAIFPVLHPSTAIWWFLPGFAAVCLSWEITLQLWSLYSQPQANAYRAYSSVQAGFDCTRVLRWMGLLIVVPIGIATILALPIHTTLTPTEIKAGHFARLTEDVYPYADATDITQFNGYSARDGSFQPRAGVLIHFKDGRTWNSADTDDPKHEVDPQLVSFLLDHTHLGLRQTHLQPDHP